MSTASLRLGVFALAIACLSPALADEVPADGAVAPGAAITGEASASAAPAAAASAGLAVTLPDIDANEYFQGDTGGTFGKALSKALAPKSRRVAIAGFRVVYVTDAAVSAHVRASYLPGRDKTAASAKMEVALEGVDPATMQSLTDRAYATFVEQLKLAGREVVPAEEIKPMYADIELAKASAEAPYAKTINLGYGKRTALTFAPSGLPLWWSNWDQPWSDTTFSQSNYKAFRGYSDKVKAIVIAPTIVVDFAQMQSSGNQSGLVAREASVGATLGIGIAEMSATAAFIEGRSGPEGMLRLKQAIMVEQPFGEMVDAGEDRTVGLLARMTGAARSKSSKIARTDNERYAAAAGEALGRATGALAKFFQQNPPG